MHAWPDAKSFEIYATGRYSHRDLAAGLPFSAV